MPRRSLAYLALLMALMGGLLLWVRLSGGRGAPVRVGAEAPRESSRQPPARVERLGDDDPLRFTGVLVARESASLSPQFGGRLESVTVQVGDTVRRGDAVARLDTTLLQRDIAIVNASVKMARAELETARLALEEVRERLGRRSDARQLQLGVLSEEEVATVRYQERAAVVRVAGAQAKVLEQEAQIARLQQQVQSATLRAPFDGTVSLRYADPGIQVTQGQPIVQVVRSQEQWVRFAIPERDAPRITPGMDVEIFIPERSLSVRGQVEKVAPEVDAASRMVLAIASLREPAPASTLSGLAVEVRAWRAKRTELVPGSRHQP